MPLTSTPVFDPSQNSNVINGALITGNAANSAAAVVLGGYPGGETVVGTIHIGYPSRSTTNFAIGGNSSNGQTFVNAVTEIGLLISGANTVDITNQVVVVTGETRCTGNFVVQTAGKGIQIQSGTGARGGNATLVGGTVTVTNTTVTAKTVILLNRKTPAGTLGAGGYAYTLSTGTSFTINAVDLAGVLSVLDTSTISYMLIEVN